MSARYLIRLDDACDTMARSQWARLEAVFERHSVRPIVSVVPDNRDPALAFEARDPSFWGKVRAWQAKGWTVAMHGHTHVMHATQETLLVPFYQRSEFAGLPLVEQKHKLRTAWRLFQDEGVNPSMWVAPAHSFNLLTLQALREETPIRIVSDGIAFDTFFMHNFHWIPQQLWRFARRRSGLWTVCLHPNDMSDAQIDAVDAALATDCRGRVLHSSEVRLRRGGRSLPGWAYHQYFWWRWRRLAAGATAR